MNQTIVRHPIKVVTQRTGLSSHVIRAWEKRYGTVSPQRSEGNQRLYSEEDVRRLTLLKHATDAGHSIGTITHLAVPQLQSLLSTSPNPLEAKMSHGQLTMSVPARDPAQLTASAFDAVARLDAAGLEQILEEGAISLGQSALLAQLVAPLVQRIGAEWRQGTLRIAHEHLASSVIRTFLCQAARPLAIHAAAPVLLATTPAGQLHEIGAAMAAAAATSQGWRVVYMGASLPAEEIVSAAHHHQARVVALSIVHPTDDPHLADELRRLRRMLPPTTDVVVGGRATAAYRQALDDIKATVCNTLDELTGALDGLRLGGHSSVSTYADP